MSFATKSLLAFGVLAGAAALPAPAVQPSMSGSAIQGPAAMVPPAGRRAAPPSRAVQLAAEVAGDDHCFVARKKAALRKAANHMRLVKVCN